MTAAPATDRRLALLAGLAAAGTGIQVGATLVASRYVVEQTGPATLTLLRYALGLAVLLIPALLAPKARFAPRDLLAIALLGIGQFALLVALLNIGLQYTTAARAALVFASMPLLTLLFAAMIGQERLGGAKGLGVLLTLIGVGLALGEALGAPTEGGKDWLGALAVLGSAVTGALCSVLYRSYLARYPVVRVGALAMAAAILSLLLPAWWEQESTPLASIDRTAALAVLFIGLSSGVFFFLWLWALRHAPASRVAVFLALSPPTAALLGVTLLNEPLTPSLLAGSAAIIAGIVLAHRQAA
ncbi:MAG: DMT family transporter [Oceanibaculum nanhaiense]|uniref:DMT family transporter n=1 Tax=Oceanibaculum nanhaiense TaxID=1909734 RepID=UPI0025A4123C|nr:DMT family transporter [Oceanibaculum nanhaiense]MDM7945895.1 DMT family transporter [Oceanibaculum nanhaiense]